MPQRTRKEKQAAQQRKASRYTLIDRSVKTAVPPQSDKKAAHQPLTPTNEDRAIRSYFLHDLRKSTIFILCIFALEFFLHFVRIGNYFSR